MRIRKGDAYLISSLLVLIAYIIATFVTSSITFYDATMAAFVAIAGMFIGGNVVDNRMKGKYFQEGLKD